MRLGLKWSSKDYHFKGYSIAGLTTTIFFENAKVCFDVGQGLPFQMSANYFLLTHLHADHGMGIPYVLSQRAMMSLPPAKVFVPESNIEPLDQIIRSWQKLEGYTYDYQLLPAREDQLWDIDSRYCFRAFKTHHRVVSNGYLIYEKKKRLRDEFKHKTQNELLKIKDNAEVNESWIEPIIAFTGDTTIDFLKTDEDAKRAKILFVEATFIDDKKNIQHAKKWGHTHLDEIIENLDQITSETICLIHFSGRYTTNDIKSILDKKIPFEHKSRLQIFPRAF